MHSIHPTYWTLYLSLAYLRCAQNTSTSWAKSSNTRLFYNKVLNISCNLLNTVLKVKNKWLSWCRIPSVPIDYPHELIADWGLWVSSSCCWCPTSRKRIYQTTYCQPGKRSKFKLQFLLNIFHFCIIG